MQVLYGRMSWNGFLPHTVLISYGIDFSMASSVLWRGTEIELNDLQVNQAKLVINICVTHIKNHIH